MSSGDPSTALFDEYDAEYCAKATEVARKLDGLAGLGSADARRKAVRDIERDLSEAEAVLSRMELEARSAAPTSAARGRALTAKVAAYRADAAALAKRAREAAKAAAASSSGNAGGGDLARAELGLGGGASISGVGGGAGRAGGGGGGGFSGGSGSSNNDRDRVLAAGERIERSGERIAQGRAQLLQTEALGASILESLAAQRAAIERSRERLAETDGSLAAGGRALKRMGAWFPWLGRQD